MDEVLLPQNLDRQALFAANEIDPMSGSPLFCWLESMISASNEALQQVLDVLDSIPQSEISGRHYTIAMIKPRLDEEMKIDSGTPLNVQIEDDSTRAEYLIDQIPCDLSILTTFSLKLTQEEVEAWYAGSLDRQAHDLAIDPNRYGADFANR